ncbi:hypothetical protein [Chitinasiproducens palmae]|nr:hypothetical protein [Chitinasiproducens palmae]
MPATTQPLDSLTAIVNDEFAGKAGTYLFDPRTGKRQPMIDALPAPVDIVEQQLPALDEDSHDYGQENG